MGPNLLKTANLVTFTEEILDDRLHFFLQCNDMKSKKNHFNLIKTKIHTNMKFYSEMPQHLPNHLKLRMLGD